MGALALLRLSLAGQALDDLPLPIALGPALLPVIGGRQRDVCFDEQRRLLDDRLQHLCGISCILTRERDAGDLVARGDIAGSNPKRARQVSQGPVVLLPFLEQHAKVKICIEVERIPRQLCFEFPSGQIRVAGAKQRLTIQPVYAGKLGIELHGAPQVLQRSIHVAGSTLRGAHHHPRLCRVAVAEDAIDQ